MKYKNVFRIAVDCDDVLLPCIDLALNIMQKKYNFDPPLDLNEITGWLPSGGRADCLLECFNDPEFFKSQTPLKGAQEFIKELTEKGTVYILTAIKPEFMGIRAQTIMKYFPDIDPNNIILTSSKNVVDIDVLIDDGAHNILTSKAQFPILLRRPWNNHLSGILAVNNYAECLNLIDVIKNRYTQKPLEKDKLKIVSLIGPSGSEKTELVKELLKTGKFTKPISYTTRKKRKDEDENSYYFVDNHTFNNLKDMGEIFESTVYSECAYGSSKHEIEKILASGKNVVIPIDMCGAMGLKSEFENAVTIYVDRSKKQLLTSLLEKNISIEDKVNRILSIDAEERNSDLCDYIVNNDADLSKVVNEILSIVN